MDKIAAKWWEAAVSSKELPAVLVLLRLYKTKVNKVKFLNMTYPYMCLTSVLLYDNFTYSRQQKADRINDPASQLASQSWQHQLQESEVSGSFLLRQVAMFAM